MTVNVTFDLDDASAKREIEKARAETGLPATDPVRYDPAPLVDAIMALHEQVQAARSR